MECRTSGPNAIIGITDIKSQFKLKEPDLKRLRQVKEPKPAFLGGRDSRWYLRADIEKRAEIVAAKKEKEKKDKVEAKRVQKELEKKAKAAGKARKLGEKKRKRDDDDDEDEELVADGDFESLEVEENQSRRKSQRRSIQFIREPTRPTQFGLL